MDVIDTENPFVPASADTGRSSTFSRTYYQILEVSTDANRADIRSAYIRMKRSLGLVGSATYSLLDSEDHARTQRELEEAYRTLDDEYLRQRYDAMLNNEGDQAIALASKRKTFRASFKVAEQSCQEGVQEQVAEIVSSAEKIDGGLLRRIRVAVGIEPEQILGHLKISVFYLKALEEDDFAKLPPLVYVRGFLKSLLEYLGVSDLKRLVDGYSGNLQEWKKKNEKK